jgi:hypothetical protein
MFAGQLNLIIDKVTKNIIQSFRTGQIVAFLGRCFTYF